MMMKIPAFYLSSFPVNFTDLINDYEFEDNQIIKISYLIKKPNTNLNAELQNEFDEYFMN